ncbi:ubiquinol oxidase subunit II [Sphingomonas alba]|uniref:Ubiquinol oxidase subunit 2 n=1 Tax=Sphingomonas alba TaxID=2908208 RepID=A0ABT0RNC4_9SPHN|nr:ubiquinol oxidase subunit II [Sphingomonas alba]MCL6683977.1 ubiquinol oxidase subunit II [Sphingomonas alba]
MTQRLHPRTRRFGTLILVAAVGLLSACQRGVLNPAGDVARQQRDIIYISTGLMLLIIVPVMLLIVIFAWRYRKGQGGTYDPEFDHSTSLELVIWSAPLLIIIMLGALTWSSTHLLDPFRPLDRVTTDPALAAEPRQEALHVQVVSMDWKWLFIYPDQGIATVNELVLPVNREVRFDITSTNMMNTFYAPTLAGMIYAMPGMQSQLHAVLNRPVDDEGFSANYSGRGFSDMRFALHGVDSGKFDQWVASSKGSGRTLDLPTYLQLLKPSEKVPAMRFAGVDQDLYRRILERCVEPGKPCATEVMAHEPMGAGAMPAGRESMPTNKPEGALMKSPGEKGAQPNRNRFVAPGNEADKGPTH